MNRAAHIKVNCKSALTECENFNRRHTEFARCSGNPRIKRGWVSYLIIKAKELYMDGFFGLCSNDYRSEDCL